MHFTIALNMVWIVDALGSFNGELNAKRNGEGFAFSFLIRGDRSKVHIYIEINDDNKDETIVHIYICDRCPLTDHVDTHTPTHMRTEEQAIAQKHYPQNKRNLNLNL